MENMESSPLCRMEPILIQRIRDKPKGAKDALVHYRLPPVGARVQGAVRPYLPYLQCTSGISIPLNPGRAGGLGDFENSYFLPIVAVFQESFHIKGTVA